MLCQQNILIVDDEDASLLLLKAVIEQLDGFTVFTASGCEQAIRLIEENEFVFALLDVCLPGCSGIDIAKVLKENNPSGVGIIFITASTETLEMLEKLYGAGADDVMFKPLGDCARLALKKKVLKYCDDYCWREKAKKQEMISREMALLKRFAGSVIHELNNKLTNICVGLQMIKSPDNYGAVKACNAVVRIVKGFGEYLGVSMEFQSIRLEDIVSEKILSHNNIADNVKASLVTSGDYYINGNACMLQTVMMNILNDIQGRMESTSMLSRQKSIAVNIIKISDKNVVEVIISTFVEGLTFKNIYIPYNEAQMKGMNSSVLVAQEMVNWMGGQIMFQDNCLNYKLIFPLS